MIRGLAGVVFNPACKTRLLAATFLTTMTHPTVRAAEGGGDRPAVDWAAALADHDRWLRTVVAARTGERGAVDEVMQEVAMAAVRQSAPLSDVTKVAPWLYRLAVTQSLLYRRKMGRRRRLTNRFAERRAASPDDDGREPDPLAWLLADERRRLIREALGKLNRRDAEVLLLKYTEDWNYSEIAGHLGIGHSAVEARLHRARQRMREQLAALDVIEPVRG